MSVDPKIIACYRKCQAIAGLRLPYALGGGHDPSKPFQPSKDIRSQYANVIGYDCSGVISAVLHGGGILEHDHALGTHELEHWGLSGRGRWMTVHVINRSELEHAVIEFTVPGWHEWFAARHTGTTVGWLPYDFDATGYTQRRRKA